ncbi:MAG: menaquinone biosynthesis protein [Desulfohalobiaceae bacterium]
MHPESDAWTTPSWNSPDRGNEPHGSLLRLGRIGYINVLPVYYALEQGLIAHDMEMVYGTPAELNELACRGELDIASTSSIEYARNWRSYYLVPHLAIGSRGPVQSVLLLSRKPLDQLDGGTILVSAQTHTSATLLRILLRRHVGIRPRYENGDISSLLRKGETPEAFLAIGDEALLLRDHQEYSYSLDLGQAWLEWTGLPFIFGVWVADAASVRNRAAAVRQACHKLYRSKEWGRTRTKFFADLAADRGMLDRRRLASYFRGLVYELEEWELRGLDRFFELLCEEGEITEKPGIRFFPSPEEIRRNEKNGHT